MALDTQGIGKNVYEVERINIMASREKMMSIITSSLLDIKHKRYHNKGKVKDDFKFKSIYCTDTLIFELVFLLYYNRYTYYFILRSIWDEYF